MNYNVMEYKESGIRTKYIGSREFVDTKTGEVFDMEIVEKTISHKLKSGWRRVYLDDLLSLFSDLYGKRGKMKAIEWMLDNLDSENKLTYTQRQIAEKAGVAICVVNETLKFLLERDFMRKKGTAYVVNPKFVCSFGSDKKNIMIGVKYREDD